MGQRIELETRNAEQDGCVHHQRGAPQPGHPSGHPQVDVPVSSHKRVRQGVPAPRCRRIFADCGPQEDLRKRSNKEVECGELCADAGHGPPLQHRYVTADGLRPVSEQHGERPGEQRWLAGHNRQHTPECP